MKGLLTKLIVGFSFGFITHQLLFFVFSKSEFAMEFLSSRGFIIFIYFLSFLVATLIQKETKQ